jgi:hypothetical protein
MPVSAPKSNPALRPIIYIMSTQLVHNSVPGFFRADGFGSMCRFGPPLCSSSFPVLHPVPRLHVVRQSCCKVEQTGFGPADRSTPTNHHSWCANSHDYFSRKFVAGSTNRCSLRVHSRIRYELTHSFPRSESARKRQTRHTASRTIRFDILLSPRLRSTNTIGISPIRKPFFHARKLISIWNA